MTYTQDLMSLAEDLTSVGLSLVIDQDECHWRIAQQPLYVLHIVADTGEGSAIVRYQHASLLLTKEDWFDRLIDTIWDGKIARLERALNEG